MYYSCTHMATVGVKELIVSSIRQVLYRHAGGNRDGAFTDWFAFTATSGARAYLTPVSGVFWVVVELTDRELPSLDANVPLTVTHGDLATITALNLRISQAGKSSTLCL